MAQTVAGALFSKGTFQTRPLYFNGKHFSYWKIKIETFIKSYDVRVWRIIKLGDLSLVSNNKDKDGNKPKNGEASTDSIPTLEDYTDEQMKII